MNGARSASVQVHLCRLEEVDDPGARGFDVETPAGTLPVIVVRIGDMVRGYHNSCPHQGTPLETFPDRFLSRDAGALICSTHGAMFRPEDGKCVSGPCKGTSLGSLPVERMGTDVVLNLVERPS